MMPKGVYKKSERHLRKIVETRRKNGSYKISENQKENIRKANKGKHYSPQTEFKKGQVAPMKGKKRPDWTGEKNNKWKGGISKQKGYNNIFNIRYKARKYQAEGSHTFGEWEILKAQYNWTCPHCQKKEPEIKLTEDHIIPLSKGGSDNIENIQPLCKNGNSQKYNKIIKKYET